MRTKVTIAILLCFAKILGQTNAIYPANQSTPGSVNVSVGYQAGPSSSSTSSSNVFIGKWAGKINMYGSGNCFTGYQSGDSNDAGTSAPPLHATASYGSFYGYAAGTANTTGDFNSFFGVNSGYLNSTGYQNTFIGQNSGMSVTSGYQNTIVGSASGSSGLFRTIILADGSGYIGFYVNSSRDAGIGTTTPGNKLEITKGVAGNSGLRFTNLTSVDTPSTNPGNGVLSVNANGDVILVTDKVGTSITNSCTTAGYVPRVVDAAGNLGCSAIFDDGANHIGVLYGTTPPSGVNFSVNGNLSTTGIYNSSDKRFKKDIKPIPNALDIITALDGKTYTWNRESNPKINFDDNLHSGLLAQDLEKILPHVVMTDGDGMKSVNYIEIIPYLIEAIKQQQHEIADLKAQMSENFKTSNADLINLPNTKIISVSPNPSNDQVTVSFNIDKSVVNAKLVVFDLSGNTLSSLSVNDRDNNLSRTFQKNNLGAGVYVVSLVVNGKSIDAKKIVFN